MASVRPGSSFLALVVTAASLAGGTAAVAGPAAPKAELVTKSVTVSVPKN